jgi:hypothetical protein
MLRSEQPQVLLPSLKLHATARTAKVTPASSAMHLCYTQNVPDVLTRIFSFRIRHLGVSFKIFNSVSFHGVGVNPMLSLIRILQSSILRPWLFYCSFKISDEYLI